MTEDREERFDTIYDVYDRMGMDARVQPLKDELLDIKTERDLELAREFVNQRIGEGFVSSAQLHRRTGAKQSAISAFRNKKWKGAKGTLYTLASDLCKAINAIQRQRQDDQTRIDGYVNTRVAEQIWSVAEYTRKRRLIGAVVLPAGAGKTITLQALRDATPGSILLTATRTRCRPRSFLQSWARLLGVGEHGRAEDIQDRIMRRMSDSDRLVLIDECHKLPVVTLDVIREIWDECHIPIVLAGTPSFKTTLTSTRAGTVERELLDQLYSRVGVFRELSDLVGQGAGDGPELLATVEDIKKLFARGRVRLSRDGVDFLYRLANSPAAGELRRCKDIVQMAADMYAGETVTAQLLQGCLDATIGAREAGFMGVRGPKVKTAERPPEAATA